MQLPPVKAAPTEFEGYLWITALFLGLGWLFGSVEAAHNHDASLFSSLGSLGLLAIALNVWTNNAVLKRYEAQIGLNVMHAIAHLHVSGLAQPNNMRAAGDLARTASWYAKWLSEEKEKLRAFEAVVVGVATIQLAFGERLLSRYFLCGTWQC